MLRIFGIINTEYTFFSYVPGKFGKISQILGPSGN